MDERCILILPPSRRDGEVTSDVFQRVGIACRVCYSPTALAEEMAAGAGVLVLTDTALNAANIEHVLSALSRQPPWSDIPVVLLTQAGADSALAARIAALTNVTLLDRPTSARSLVSAVQAALRGRLRQYQTRDQLEALRAAEESLRARERELRIADRRKDEFLAMLAHELRNPLAPIRNASEVLMRTLPGDPQLQATMGMVKRQITHLTRLVDDLLDVSRITQGRIELQRETIDLAVVIAQAMESVEPLIRERQHRVLVAAQCGPLYMDGDAARVVQCVSNIMANAAKYTDPHGEIRVDVRRDGAHAVIAITDNGVGIPPELLPHIFDLFVQSKRSLDRAQGGLGIGLSVVHRLIEMHGGSVSARSEGAGRGSTFEVRLPLIAAPAKIEPQLVTHPVPARRILIVDDNADAADSLALLLRLDGHSAEPVYSPADALERASAFDPDVILLDIGLPEMDGYEVAKRIRAGGSHARLIALTGYGQSEDLRRAMAAGFDAHLVKPVDLPTLLHTLVN